MINAANEPRVKTDCYHVDEGSTIKCHGFIDEAFAFVEEKQLLRADLWKRFVQQFKEDDADYEGGWRCEYWGKMMRGACFVYSYTRDQKLYEQLENTILDMLSAQEENGRISSYAATQPVESGEL